MDNGLPDEQIAKAHWAGWQTARRLHFHDQSAWHEWLVNKDWGSALKTTQAPPPPPSLKVEPLFTFEQTKRAVALDALGRIAQALLEALRMLKPELPPTVFDHRLFGIGPDGWYIWAEGKFQPNTEEAGPLRSHGGVLLVVATQVQDTLNAVGERLVTRLPSKVEELAKEFDLRHKPFSDFSQELRRKREQDKTADALHDEYKDLIKLCHQVRPDWLEKAFQNQSDTLLSAWKTWHSDLIPSPREGNGAQRPRSSLDDRLRKWLQNYLEKNNHDGSAVDKILEEDPGLKVICGWSRNESLRDFILPQRLQAMREYREKFGVGDCRQFDKLAPVLDLGAGRNPVSPGLPILDTLWAIRGLQDTFPGRFGANTGSRLCVEQVALVCRDREASEPRSPEQNESRHCVLFGREDETRFHNVRQVGQGILERVEAEQSLKATSTQFFVCVRLNDGTSSQTLNIAFPWRFGKRRWGGNSHRDQNTSTDTKRLDEVKEGLEKLVLEEPELSQIGATVSAVSVFITSWKAYQSAAVQEGFAEEAGLHIGKERLWNPAQQLIESYDNSLQAFIELFKEAGDLAPRIAAGPLRQFLGFGLQLVEDDKGNPTERLRILGYHPLRLARLVELERDALAELQTLLKQSATLRGIPITSIPPLRGGPSVLLPLQDEQGQGRETNVPFLIPATDQNAATGEWEEIYMPFRHPRDREPDLIEPLRPLLEGLTNCIFPGLSRRLSVRLHRESDTDRCIRPLQLLADAVVRDGLRVTDGVDLYLDSELAADSIVSRPDDDTNEANEDLQRITRALTTLREDDPRLPLEVYSPPAPVQKGLDSNLDTPATHLTLLVRPFGRRSDWVIRQQPGASADSKAMLWDSRSLSWDRLMVGSMHRELLTNGKWSSGSLECSFQNLLIRCWRGEADTLLRCLGQSLVCNPALPAGQQVLDTIREAGKKAGRVLIADTVFGAEALDQNDLGQQSGMRVTWADYHRRSGWRLTLLCRKDQDVVERQVATRGLQALFPDISAEVGELAYEATHRAVPSVTLELWKHGRLSRPPEVDGELIGHLGVALFVSYRRKMIQPGTGAWPDYQPWNSLRTGFPEGTLLISMDRLQSWTWTRRSGTRGDFIAVVPAPENPDHVWLLAIEAKGSSGDKFYNGCRQAATAARKLQERFGKPERRLDRQELLRCLAQEAFRTPAQSRDAYDRIARMNAVPLRCYAVCVSTARGGHELRVQYDKVPGEPDKPVLWICVGGKDGLRALTGM